jgi:membrane peptidoglycan carboxypeptidase
VVIMRAPYFSHLVIQQLSQMYGWQAVYRGGLRVYTSLDINLQAAAQNDMDEWIEGLRSEGAIRGGLVGQGALACVDVHDGRVLAMIGGIGPYDKLQYNRAAPGPPQYGRQPGSSFKPYIWCTALESGYGPDSTFSGDAISLPLGNGKDWTPKNYKPGQDHEWTLRDALAQSVNLVSVRVLKEVTPERAREYAAKIMNIPLERLSTYMALALGVSELSPLEQASGYAVFASGGWRYDRTTLLQIDDYWGRTVYQAPLQATRVIAPETAISMISMLHGVVENGTGQRAQSVGFPAGGKTGTTQSGRDAWWVGFTPDLCAAVWVGNEDYSPMNDASGGGFCAPIWAKFMNKAMQDLGYNGKFPEGTGVTASGRPHRNREQAKAQTITMCADSDMRATPNCPRTYEKTFQPGERIPGYCTIHGGNPGGKKSGTKAASGGKTVTVSICADSGMLAGPYCPHTVERTFPAGQAPKKHCTLHKGH